MFGLIFAPNQNIEIEELKKLNILIDQKKWGKFAEILNLEGKKFKLH